MPHDCDRPDDPDERPGAEQAIATVHDGLGVPWLDRILTDLERTLVDGGAKAVRVERCSAGLTVYAELPSRRSQRPGGVEPPAEDHVEEPTAPVSVSCSPVHP